MKMSRRFVDVIMSPCTLNCLGRQQLIVDLPVSPVPTTANNDPDDVTVELKESSR